MSAKQAFVMTSKSFANDGVKLIPTEIGRLVSLTATGKLITNEMDSNNEYQ